MCFVTAKSPLLKGKMVQLYSSAEQVKDDVDDGNMKEDSRNTLSEKSTCCSAKYHKHKDDTALITESIPESDRLEHNIPESIL